MNIRRAVRRLESGNQSGYPTLLCESRSPLWTIESAMEASLQLGKVQNLRKACKTLHRVLVPAGEVFSFWMQLGRATRRSGYVLGRELRQGCLIPTIGGGLCQLSNALYDLALRCDCEIVERHPHTSIVPGSAAEHGRDATVFWNYVDFRFRPRQDILITCVLSRNELVVCFWGKQPFQIIQSSGVKTQSGSGPETCTECDKESCFRHINPARHAHRSKTAFLIEECWPEFQEFVAGVKTENDVLYLPFHSRIWTNPRYAWQQNGFQEIHAASLPTALSVVQERLGMHKRIAPIEVQLRRSKELASFYAARLSFLADRLYVAQSLLPELWKNGDLGGRSFSVLLSRFPMALLHQKLDALVAKYPDRKSFSEFRAPEWMVQAESEALAEAGSIITPHSALARLYPDKAIRLKWSMLPHELRIDNGRPKKTIVFPGPSFARKGAFELREAVRGLDCRILTLAQAAESKTFWKGFPVSPAGSRWLEQASVVVQPAFIENNPRPLLRALNADVPVIATPECGVDGFSSLTLVPEGDPTALANALRSALI